MDSASSKTYDFKESFETEKPIKKTGLALFSIGLLVLLVSATGFTNEKPLLFFLLSIGLATVGGFFYLVPHFREKPEGIKNNGIFFASMTSKGTLAWIVGILITGFYILLYWFPEFLQNWIKLVDPLSLFLRNSVADQWFLYGTFYTLAVLVMGTRMIIRYRHNNYQILRTSSVMFFQLGFAFLIPGILKSLNQPDFYFTYFWPLRPYSLYPSDIQNLLSHEGGLGVFMVFWGIVMTFVATPILTYFYGKRWYCSWVCGCGGLAETLGDPYRQLSDKSLKAWKIERVMIYSILVFVVLTTSLLWLNFSFGGEILGNLSANFQSTYGFLIGSAFSGVIGVGFYPIMGSRVWCRFGCPMAAILGILQKYFSRFRITTNGSQCISCGNCSTYCEMGIDVRLYAQRQENILRASCVGCGICAAVCPRGVLKLENGK
ncbi:4Fe-4S binding protein [bacterium]|nr:4Fe-4S binding protein [bacterium]